MPDPKPSGVSQESWTESLIRQAQAEGRFANLPGEGAPLSAAADPYDELWWARSVLEREKIAFLPAALSIRRDVERTLDRISQLDTETGVRAALDALNERIREVNTTTFDGPPTTVAPLDIEAIVRRWQSAREGGANASSASAVPSPLPGTHRRRAWKAYLLLAGSLTLAGLTALLWWQAGPLGGGG